MTSDATLVEAPPPAGTGPRVRARVPMPLTTHVTASTPTMVSFRGLRDAGEHVALVIPGPPTGAPLVRVHSECLTGDVFASARCDCGAQLDEALAVMASTGGILLYLRQEGRGIGLYNKLDAYRLQDAGYDTLDANLELDLPADARRYGVAADMLTALGVDSVALITNNPDKVRGLEDAGIRVTETMRTGVHITEHNRRYLSTKATRLRHRLGA